MSQGERRVAPAAQPVVGIVDPLRLDHHEWSGGRVVERRGTLDVVVLPAEHRYRLRLDDGAAAVACRWDGDFPDRRGMLGIVDANIEHALGYLR